MKKWAKMLRCGIMCWNAAKSAAAMLDDIRIAPSFDLDAAMMVR